jgi:hypothetical protein
MILSGVFTGVSTGVFPGFDRRVGHFYRRF